MRVEDMQLFEFIDAEVLHSKIQSAKKDFGSNYTEVMCRQEGYTTIVILNGDSPALEYYRYNVYFMYREIT